MRYWRRGSVLPRLCSGRSLKRALLGLCLVITTASAQTPQPKSAAKKATAKKANELTLAGLRPGKDTAARLFRLYPNLKSSATTLDGQISWADPCRQERLTLDIDSSKNVQVIRVGRLEESPVVHCETTSLSSRWKTGLGLHLLDEAQSVIRLYGEPDSRSPSTKDGQPLELWYYAFDWAGPEVPQVMEVVCTKDKDGQPGRVVEITLAAPSL
jgi:hypothetical protein